MGDSRVLTYASSEPVTRVLLTDGSLLVVLPIPIVEGIQPVGVHGAFTREFHPDSEVAFYIRRDEEVTVGMLMEAFGPDAVVKGIF